MIHMMGSKELKLDYPARVSLEDLETGERVNVNTKEARSGYIHSIEEYHKEISQAMLERGIDYHLLDLGEPMGEALGMFLKKRKRLL